MADDADLVRIERRVAGVRAVRQVVHAIWALARAQLPMAAAAAAEATVYLEWVDDVVQRLAQRSSLHEEENALFIVFGPQRPYCGSLPRQIASRIPKGGRLGIVGDHLAERVFEDETLRSKIAFELPSSASHVDHIDTAREVATRVVEHAGLETVELLYPRRAQTELYRAVLLPRRLELVCAPPPTLCLPSQVLDAAVRELVAGRLAVALAETLLSEVQARIVAAEAAQRASDRRLDELTAVWRTARQEQVTTELLEVVAGRFAALEPSHR